MHYIILDFEFNQDYNSEDNINGKKPCCPFEIIQIGAVKLDQNLTITASFRRFVKPSIYNSISGFITELTGITTEQLRKEKTFDQLYPEFIAFLGGSDSILCTWGLTDIKELYRNAAYHHLDQTVLPRMYINLQPYASLYLDYNPKQLLKLQFVVEELHIPMKYSFHDAYHDAVYTAEIMKQIYTSKMEPKIYDPSLPPKRPRLKKQIIDYDKLIRQFEKMYDRPMTSDEKQIIKLAYHMGKTKQFIKFNH
ncbi:MAG: hypothetical protein K0S47_1261 [Herbinix sp.]|jgi:DNA polymerase III epsilon subunit-like protein|nr:hypothetical protein [Herbinix sp.]